MLAIPLRRSPIFVFWKISRKIYCLKKMYAKFLQRLDWGFSQKRQKLLGDRNAAKLLWMTLANFSSRKFSWLDKLFFPGIWNGTKVGQGLQFKGTEYTLVLHFLYLWLWFYYMDIILHRYMERSYEMTLKPVSIPDPDSFQVSYSKLSTTYIIPRSVLGGPILEIHEYT